ncbi:V-type ATPase subunit [Enterococcus faecalis]|nr:V-type ATPase subunit [Enterococcus faecalis]
MRKPTYHQINPLIRLKETELLSEQQFQQLLEAETVEDVKNMLKSTVYQPYLTETFEEKFDYHSSEALGNLYRWLYEMAPEPAVVTLYTMPFTFHNLKILTKAEQTGKDFDYLYLEDGRYSLNTVKSAIHTKNSSELEPALLEVIRDVFAYLEEGGLPQAIDILYDRAFLQQQRKLADELGYEELTKEVIAFIDLTNLSTMARGIVQHQNSNFLSTVLSSAGSLSKKELLTYAEKSLVEFTAFVRTTNYGQLLEKIINKETNELNLLAFEKLKDDYLTSMYENGRTVAFGPLPLLAFLNAKEVEWKNLRLILVGKHSGFSNEKIRERMRKVNGV